MNWFRRSTQSAPSHSQDAASWSLSRWMLAALFCVLLALAFLVGLAVWGVAHDLRLLESNLIESEMGRLRSHAFRTVNNTIQFTFQQVGSHEISVLAKEDTYLRKHWKSSVFNDKTRLYAAVVDLNGQIVVHSNPMLEGGTLGKAWYDKKLSEINSDIVDTQDPTLTGGDRALDVNCPIYVDGKEIGTYHSGLRYDWLQTRIGEDRDVILQIWGVILALMVACFLAAAFSFYQIVRKITVFSQAMKVGRHRRFAELGQLMAGLVHEIRNPLNAMRLNLHVLGRYISQMPSTEAAALLGRTTPQDVIGETNREIERVEGLLRILLGYARPDQPHNEILDLRDEVKATLSFLKPVLEKGEIMVKMLLPEKPLQVFMDRDRLRQIILNLINNAKEATGSGGHIQVEILGRGQVVEVAVLDDGPGVPRADRDRIFEPFFSTKDLGTGLGLALVRRFMEEIGGTVRCEDNKPRGARFVLHFPSTTASGINELTPTIH